MTDRSICIFGVTSLFAGLIAFVIGAAPGAAALCLFGWFLGIAGGAALAALVPERPSP